MLGFVRNFIDNSFGSDELTPYTAVYTWQANQMAHAMIGFGVATATLKLVQDSFGVSGEHYELLEQTTGFYLALSIPFLCLIVKDFVLDISLDAVRRRKAMTDLRLDWRAVVRDCITDVGFWWCGMGLAYCMLLNQYETAWDRIPYIFGWIAICLALWAYPWGRYWLRQKKAYDDGNLPSTYERLAKFSHPEVLMSKKVETLTREDFANDPQTRKIVGFQVFVATLTPNPSTAHYILFDGLPTDRSRLLVSLGCEFVYRSHSVFATTAIELLEDPDRIFDKLDQALGIRVFAGKKDDLAAKAEHEKQNQAIREKAKAQGKGIRCLLIDDLHVNMDIPDLHPKAIADAMAAAPTGAPEPAAQRSQNLVVPEKTAEQAKHALIRLRDFVRDYGVTTIFALSGSDEAKREYWIGTIFGFLTVPEERRVRIKLSPRLATTTS